MASPFRAALGLGAACWVLLASGCGGGGGPPPVLVRGTLTDKGKPLHVKEQVGHLDVHFIPYKEKLDKDEVIPLHDASVEPDGTFTVRGPDGRGIPPGKYRITITWQDDYPMGPDKLKGRFNEQNSRIVRDVTGSEEIHLDVSRPEG